MSPLLLDILTLLGGLMLLGWGGDLLVRGSVTIAFRLGISPLIVGLTVVAFGTSAPELAFNVIAAVSGSGGLVYGNIVGSNICNIGLILGVAALLSPLTVSTALIKREIPVMIAALVAMTMIAYTPPGGPAGGWGFGRIEGLALLAALAVYTWGTVAIALRQRQGLEVYTQSVEDVSRAELERTIVRAWMLFLAGIVLLTIGGALGKEGAVGIAHAFSIPDEIIGLTIVAIGTSLPELATVIVATRKRQIDMAVGNIVGSNIFNVLFVFGLSVTVSPVDLPAGSIESLGVMTVFGMMLLVMSRTKSGSVSRVEGGVLLGSYALYLGHQCWLAVDAARSAGTGTPTP